jgi:FMN phosphatase YigB (HAD superfamily)
VNIKAVFFDLDDTLCTYWDASKRALWETFEKHRPQDLEPDQLVAEWAAAFREFLPHVKTPEWYSSYLATGEHTRTEQMHRTLLRLERDDPALAAQLSQTYMELRNQYLELFPEALEVLNDLKGRFPLGLITNGPAVFIEGEQGIGKPEWEVFRRAEAAVGFSPEEVLFVGNSYAHDIVPAIEAGWKTVWVRRPSDVPPSVRGVQSEPEELPAGGATPDLVASNLREILPLLA